MPSPELGVVAMKRREFITLVGGAALAWPLAANAQQKGKLPLIGVLNPGSTDTPGAVGFYEGLRELGYTEGLNIAIERRYGDWNTDRFQQLAADLVRPKVDCVPECPVDAIKPDTEPGLEKWLSLNAEYAKIWPNIMVKKAPPPDSKEWERKPDKLPYFSPNPGAGD